ncbi:MAG TPA: adenosylmethionine--8-amino-7-oxononanoate transaminase [Nitrospinota bacterium]|nr:adenosylmethionine--8-amino-7-oxononanoate transaminase [Nitrospinota bacterium]|tara:strand:- start:96530 stop:98587 length:2058 start_codon:yes stop_codon:yes gene_type:complete
MKGLFITATDTGVGKTVITAAFAAILREEGIDVGVMKPVQSGCDGESEDARFMLDTTGLDDPMELVNPYLFKAPLSPYHAANAENKTIDVEVITDACTTLAAKHELVLVEGAGGLMVPITRDLYMIDLAIMLGFPSLLVAHPYLGCINHTIQTTFTAQAVGMDILGIVFNQWKNHKFPVPDFNLIQQKCETDVLGLVSYAAALDPNRLVSHVRSCIDLKQLLKIISGSMKKQGVKKRSYEERDKKYTWHPFTQMKGWMDGTVTVIESGRGVTLKDINGIEFLDGHSSYWCNMHGHVDRRLNDSIIRQLNKISHSTYLGLSNTVAIDLAEKLVEITPKGLDRVFYSDDGSTAVEAALKMGYQYWRHIEANTKRDLFISVRNAYHGDTIGAVSVGGIDQYHSTFHNLLFKSLNVPSPYCYRCPIEKEFPSCGLECTEFIDQTIKENKDRVVAMIIEPLVQCPAGIITAPHGYLQKAYEICQENDVLFIADEVATGFGRTGRMFACEHEDVTPDIMTLSKSITGGTLPFAATIASSKLFEAFLGDYEEEKTFFHGHTYTANQLGCAVSLENLKIMEERRTIEEIQEKSARVSDMLARFEDLLHVGEIRQRGLIIGIELVEDKKTKKPYGWSQQIGVRVSIEAKRMGVIVRPLGNVMVFFPAPAATILQMESMLDALYKSIKMITEVQE